MGVWSGSRCSEPSMKASEDTVGSNCQGRAQNWWGIDAFLLHVTFSLDVSSCPVAFVELCIGIFLCFLSQNANVLRALVVQPNERAQICLLHGGRMHPKTTSRHLRAVERSLC